MRRLMLLFFLSAVLLLGACQPAAPTQAPPAVAAANKPGSKEQSAGVSPTKAAAEPTAAPAVRPAQTGVPGEGSSTSPLAFSPAGSQLVIKDAELALLVNDSAQALDQVTALTSQEGGYIISSQTWYQDGYLYATLRLGIPSLRFETALNTLRRIGIQVLRENAQGQDVTDQYVDLQSRLTNLEATAARVREFLKDAKTIEDSLRINQQLAELEDQINQVKGQMNYFEGRTAYSTVTVNIVPQYPTPTPTMTPTARPTPTATPPWSAATTFNQASGVLSKQAQSFVDGAIWVGVILGPWALLITIAYLAMRGIIRKAAPRLKG